MQRANTSTSIAQNGHGVHDIDSPFPAVRYRFEFDVLSRIVLPDYAGSAIRGAFGQSLRRLSCMTGMSDCNGCSLRHSCPYSRIFEPLAPPDYHRRKFSGVPCPYVIEPENWQQHDYQPGETFSLSMVLIGPAIDFLPLVVQALSNALLRQGLGVTRGKARLMSVTQEGNSSVLWQQPGDLIVTETRNLAIPTAPSNIRDIVLRFETPLRMQNQAKRVNASSISSRDVLGGLIRRVSTIIEMQLRKNVTIDFSALVGGCEEISIDSQLKWFEWRRYSSRQKQVMKGSGLIGDIQLQGNLEPYWPFLYLGQYLHLGKMATFGNGRYTLVAKSS